MSSPSTKTAGQDRHPDGDKVNMAPTPCPGDGADASADDPSVTVCGGAAAAAGAGVGAGAGAAALSCEARTRIADAVATVSPSLGTAPCAAGPAMYGGASTSASAGDERDSKPFVVLMAGEHWMLETGQRMLGSNHCSLVPVATAYAQLVDVVGRENIGEPTVARLALAIL